MKRYVVEKDKVLHNVAQALQCAGDAKVYAVVKANGYGTGCENLAQLCAQGGIRRFAVTELREARAVAQSDFAWDEILMLPPVTDAEERRELAALGVTFTVASMEDAEALAQLAQEENCMPKAHVKIDTGMGRRGFQTTQQEQVCALYARYPQIEFTGIYTHFFNSQRRKETMEQYQSFCKLLQLLADAGIEPGVRHCCNSVAAFRYPELHLDAVRIGSGLLGRIPEASRFGLQRTGCCQVSVESVRKLPKGTSVGYGAGYRAKHGILAATCPVGSHHGLAVVRRPGCLNGMAFWKDLGSFVLNRLRGADLPTGRVCGKVCRVIGTASTEAVVLDVTGTECRSGDLAEFDINPLLINDMEVVYL